MNRRDFLRTSCAAVAVGMTVNKPGFSQVLSQAGQAVKLLDIPDLEFRLLQLTDIHFFAGFEDNPDNARKANTRTSDAMRALVEKTRPHVVIVTGDLWHNNPDGRGAEFMDFAASQLESLGVPWAYTWGNHDRLDDYAEGHRRFTGARNSLYAGSEHDGNYLIRVTHQHRPVLEIFCLNTHEAGIQEAERQWLVSMAGPEKDRPYRMAAFHIPIKQYAEVWENGTARGFIGEDVCFEQESGQSLDVLARCGIRTVICGHDHVNDYEGVMQGVRLLYGRSSGLQSYGALTLAKGGKLYTFHSETGNLTWESLPYRGKPWFPGPGERVDKRKQA